MVSGTDHRMASGAFYEREFGCCSQNLHSGRDAGAGIFLQKYAAVFYDSIGLFTGGLLVDEVFEPLMASEHAGSLLNLLFGSGKGSGAAVALFCWG